MMKIIIYIIFLTNQYENNYFNIFRKISISFSDNIYVNVNLKSINIHKSDLILVKKRIENIVWIKSVEII